MKTILLAVLALTFTGLASAKDKAPPPSADAITKIRKDVRDIYGKAYESATSDDDKADLATTMRDAAVQLDHDDEMFVVLLVAADISKKSNDIAGEFYALDLMRIKFDLPADLDDRRIKCRRQVELNEARAKSAEVRTAESKKKKIAELEKRIRALSNTLGTRDYEPKAREKGESDEDYIARMEAAVKQAMAVVAAARNAAIIANIAARQDAANADFNKRFGEAMQRAGQK